MNKQLEFLIYSTPQESSVISILETTTQHVDITNKENDRK